MPDEDAEPAASPPAEPEPAAEPRASRDAGPLPDAEVRERMRTLDARERKWGFIAGGFVLALSVLYVPELLHTTYGPPTAKPYLLNRCRNGLHLVHKLCETVYHPSDYALQFSILIILGVVFLLSVWRAKRSLTIFFSMLAGLASTFVGGVVVLIVGLGYGGWLLARSWRMQRYGTTDSKEVRELATERAEAKRAARRAGKGGGTDRLVPRSGVTASKRYTPRAKPRRR